MSKKEKAGKFISEFKAFALKGNMVDMAIGMIIGTAFSGLVSGLVKNIFTPALSIFTGKIDFQNLFYAMDGNTYAQVMTQSDISSATLSRVSRCVQYGKGYSKLLK